MTRLLCLSLAALLLCACPGSLADPERFLSDGGTDGGGGDGGACNAETDIFQAKCGGSGCHSPPATVANGLDLTSPGVADRLTGPSMCMGQPLKTYMLTKVNGTPPCGATMPLTGSPLSAAELQCLTDYLATIGTDGGP